MIKPEVVKRLGVSALSGFVSERSVAFGISVADEHGDGSCFAIQLWVTLQYEHVLWILYRFSYFLPLFAAM